MRNPTAFVLQRYDVPLTQESEKKSQLNMSKTYEKCAENHKVTRSTVTRHVKDECVSRQDASLNRRLLHPQIEAELEQYMRDLTERHLVSTRQIVMNIVSPSCARSLQRRG